MFLLYGVKVVSLGGSLEAAALLAVFGSIAAFYEFKSQDKKLQDLENKFASYEEKLALREKEHKDLMVHVQGLKLSTQMKSVR